MKNIILIIVAMIFYFVSTTYASKIKEEESQNLYRATISYVIFITMLLFMVITD